MAAPIASRTRIDFASLAGLLAGPVCILVGQYLEGGSATSLLQGSAALIVIGATVGACMLSFSSYHLIAAVRDMRKIIAENSPDPYELIERIISYARVLQTEGPVSLQRRAADEPYTMLRTGLNLVINNVSEESMGAILERTFHERVNRNNAGAEVFEAAGGYLPTFGILGAVLGLIHTMHSLDDPSKVGVGIATAFVATVYGVGIANLIAYPTAKKIRARAKTERQLDKIVVTGVKALHARMTASALRQLLTEGLHGRTEGAPAPATSPAKAAA